MVLALVMVLVRARVLARVMVLASAMVLSRVMSHSLAPEGPEEWGQEAQRASSYKLGPWWPQDL